MLGLLLIPVMALGALPLVAGHFGTGSLPEHVAGFPTPMLLFIGLGLYIVATLRTI